MTPTLHVMQLISSTLTWAERGLLVNLTVDEPGSLPADKPLQMQLTLSSLTGIATMSPACSVHVRLPLWARMGGDMPDARLNGHQLTPQGDGGRYLEVSERRWSPHDRLTVSLPMKLRTERLQDERPRHRSLHAMLSGPLLLAGLTYGERRIVADPTTPEVWLHPVPAHAAAQLRSLRYTTGFMSTDAGGLGVTPLDEAPGATERHAPDVTWRMLCDPKPCTMASDLAFEPYTQPGSFLVPATVAKGASSISAHPGYSEHTSSTENASTMTRMGLVLASGAQGGHPPAAARFRPVWHASATADDNQLPLRGTLSLESRHTISMHGAPLLLCTDKTGQLQLLPAQQPPSEQCRLELLPGAARYSPLSLWARPQTGRGYLFLPLKDVVDQVCCSPSHRESSIGASLTMLRFCKCACPPVSSEPECRPCTVVQVYSVYFHVSTDPAVLPFECSAVRKPWNDHVIVSAAARELALRILAARKASWAGVQGMEFRADGVLRTPWNKGRWGVLPSGDGEAPRIWADFGGARHELAFTWPAFQSTRCSDGDTVRGVMSLESLELST